MLTIQAYDTELDKELHDFSKEYWEEFVKLLGHKNYTSLKVCYLRSKGKSLSQIARKYKKSKGWAQKMNDTKCKRCD